MGDGWGGVNEGPSVERERRIEERERGRKRGRESERKSKREIRKVGDNARGEGWTGLFPSYCKEARPCWREYIACERCARACMGVRARVPGAGT